MVLWSRLQPAKVCWSKSECAPPNSTGRPSFFRVKSLHHFFPHLILERRRLQNPPMALEFTTSCLQDSIDLLRFYKKLGDRAMAQVSDAALFATLDDESNSIAIIV